MSHHAKTLWECPKGHHWDASAADIASGARCPQCAKPNSSSGRRHFLDRSLGPVEEGTKNTKYQRLPERRGKRLTVEDMHALARWMTEEWAEKQNAPSGEVYGPRHLFLVRE